MIQSLFSVDVYETKFDDLDLLKKLSDPEYVKTYTLGKYTNHLQGNLVEVSGNTVSSIYSWLTVADSEKIHLRPEFSPLKEFIEKHAKIYWDHLGYYSDIYPKMYQSWANIFSPGGYAAVHHHGKAPISGLVYLSSIPGQGNIEFTNPMELVISTLPYLGDRTKVYKEVESLTGKIILFPGYLPHRVLVNNTDSDRISLAFNLNEDGIYIDKNSARQKNLQRNN